MGVAVQRRKAAKAARIARGFGFLEFDDVGGTLAGMDRSGDRPKRS
jgi:hypothetical protein